MAATREQVLQAYQNNPFATPFPDESAIQYWMSTGLSNFDDVVQQVRAANPTLAAEIDQQRAALSAATPAQQFSGLFSPGTDLAAQAEQVLAASGKANDPRFADAIVGTFSKDGVIYNVQGDGSIQGIIQSPTGSYLAAGFTPEGQQATEQFSNKFEQSSLDRALGVLANAAVAAGTAAALGPAGIGVLGVPGAAAAGAGVTNFANTADLQQALQAAALGGGTAFGIEQLFPTDALKTARTAADLAASGNSIDNITQTLVNQGVSPSTARTIAAEALAGSSASQIARDFAGLTLNAASTTAPAVTGGATDLVNVLGTKFNPATGLFSTGAGSLLGAGIGSTIGVAPSIQPPASPQVEVTGQTIKPEPVNLITPEVIGAAIPVVAGGTTQQVGIEGTRVTAPANETVPATVGAIIPSITPAIPTTPPASETVEVKGTREPATTIPSLAEVIIPSIVPAISTIPAATETVKVEGKRDTPISIDTGGLAAALPSIAPVLTQPLPKPVEAPAKKEDSLFTPSDILKLLTLLGGTVAAGGTGTGTMPVRSIPPSDTMLGSTTPQFGPDYYAAVQRYYNAYMPETPRNVATPLQQWYENKFGA